MNAPSLQTAVATLALSIGTTFAEETPPNFQDDIQPLFKEHCLSCHNPDKKKAGLDLTSLQSIQIGSSGGEVVKAGVPDTSALFMSVDHQDDFEPMPPKKPKLPDDQIALIRQWILGGMVESSGGKSLLRKIEFDVAAVSSTRPEGPPPMPESLPDIPLVKTARPPVITALATSPWAPLVAVSGHEQILLLHAETQEALGILPFSEGTVHVLRFSRNGSLLLAAGGRAAYSGKVVLFDVKSGKRMAEIGDEQDAVLAADLSADHRFVALGGPAKIVKIFDATNGEMLHRIDKHTDWITSLAFAPEGDHLASADRNGGIHVWEAAKGAIVYSLTEHKVRVTGLAWRADGNMLASSADDGKLVLWDTKDGWPSKVVDAHKSNSSPNRYTKTTGTLSVDWAREGTIVTSGRDRKIKLWKPSGDRSHEFPELDSIPLAVRILSGGQGVFVGGFDGSVRPLSKP